MIMSPSQHRTELIGPAHGGINALYPGFDQAKRVQQDHIALKALGCELPCVDIDIVPSGRFKLTDGLRDGGDIIGHPCCTMISAPVPGGIVMRDQGAMLDNALDGMPGPPPRVQYVGNRALADEVIEAVALVRDEHDVAASGLQDSLDVPQMADQVGLMLDIMAAETSVELIAHDGEVTNRRNEVNLDGAFDAYAEKRCTLDKGRSVQHVEIFDARPNQNRADEGADLQNGMSGKQRPNRGASEHLRKFNHLHTPNASGSYASTRGTMQ